MPSFKTAASGAASRACMTEMPEVMRPRSDCGLRIADCELSEEVSFHAWISASFRRSWVWAMRAWAGIITRPLMSRSKCVAAGGMGWRRQTIVLEWQTRVVMRSITGMRHFAEISRAARKKS